MNKQSRKLCYIAACVGLPAWYVADLFRLYGHDPSMGGAIGVGAIIFGGMIFCGTCLTCLVIECVCERPERGPDQ